MNESWWQAQPQFMRVQQSNGYGQVVLLMHAKGRWRVLPLSVQAEQPAADLMAAGETVLSTHKHGSLRNFKDLKAAIRAAEKMLPDGQWATQSAFHRMRKISGSRVWVSTSVGCYNGTWIVIVVVTKRRDETALNDHGHSLLGPFVDPISAMKAADRFKPSKEIVACVCGANE